MDLHESDFEQACDIIIWQDEWFPTVARIRAVAADCLRERTARYAGIQRAEAQRFAGIVCGTCRGARHVRLGGYSPMRGSSSGYGWQSDDRARACPDCTVDGQYDAAKERQTVQRGNGVVDPNADRQPDMTQSTWRLPRLADGRPDMEALYRQSRELRGLDPDVDDRPASVPGFTTAADALFRQHRRDLAGAA